MLKSYQSVFKVVTQPSCTYVQYLLILNLSWQLWKYYVNIITIIYSLHAEKDAHYASVMLDAPTI